MEGIAVGFLWHMHQPYYKNPVTGAYLMPWVRLHAVRGYYDMIAVLEDFPNIRCTFNLVPSLLAQLVDYTEEGLRDADYYLSEKRPDELSGEEKQQIVSRFFMCNQRTMIEPITRYADLLAKRGKAKTTAELEACAKRFSRQDILDLQVLFNLVWMGFTARKDEGIAELLRKGRSYTEADKRYVLHSQLEIMRRLVPLYRQALSEGRIEISTSPFYHPISPLVMNVGYALRCMDIPLPEESFAHPEDLQVQIERAIAFHTGLFDVPPRGMWPSEGSVCPEMIELLGACGIEWCATDEDILFASLRQARTGSRLHRPYRVRYGESTVGMFFRDRALSDNIGFVYARNPPEQAVNNLVYHLENIRKGARAYDFPPFVAVILDGENPWEAFPDSGEAFLRGLYRRLSSAEGLQTSTFSDFLDRHPATDTLANLYTGSWINHNFSIWIGHEEDRKGWEYLAKTRNYVAAKGADADALAWEEIYIAEGSDWYWWYGDEFSTENDEDFDNLFRQHLKNCYALHGDVPPAYLSQSIITPHEIAPQKVPSGFIHPTIDGRLTHFYEWRKAGLYLPTGAQSSMYRREQIISRIMYGFDEGSFFLRVDTEGQGEEAQVMVDFLTPDHLRLSVPLGQAGMDLHRREDRGDILVAHLEEVAWETVLELRIAFADLGVEPLTRVRFIISFAEQGMEKERYPGTGFLSFTVPERGYERVMWYV